MLCMLGKMSVIQVGEDHHEWCSINTACINLVQVVVI